MDNNIRMDSHKLICHPQRVADWLGGKGVYPIEMEVGISGACNHRCVFCAVDYMEYQPRMLPAAVLLPNLREMGERTYKKLYACTEGMKLWTATNYGTKSVG